MQANLNVENVAKSFTMHLMGGVRLPVVENVTFAVEPGQCAALTGPSGAGKSSILKMIYANYRTDAGCIAVRHGETMVDVVSASPRDVMKLRRDALGYVSQFLNVIPRIGALDLVMATAMAQGVAEQAARARAADALSRLNIPDRLWSLPPATFSGGERQRVNIARTFVGTYSTLLLDEPTASLDAGNRDVVVDMIEEKKQAGCALVGIFHDDDVRDAVADLSIDVTRFAPRQAA